jgi:DNA-binding NtrC family response regulator
MSPPEIPAHPNSGKPEDRASLPSVPEASHRGNLLLVDDDSMTGMVLGGWLRHQGYRADFVTNATEADRLLVTSTFDLVLSDIRMPGNFRLEWVQQLLANDAMPPILLITGTPELETALRAANLPVAGYLLKPVDFSILDGVIQRIVQEHRRRLEFIAGSFDNSRSNFPPATAHRSASPTLR